MCVFKYHAFIFLIRPPWWQRETPSVPFLPWFFPVVHLFYPFTIRFLSFSSPFFLSLPLFIFSPQMTSADIFLAPGWGGGIYRPLRLLINPVSWSSRFSIVYFPVYSSTNVASIINCLRVQLLCQGKVAYSITKNSRTPANNLKISVQ